MSIKFKKNYCVDNLRLVTITKIEQKIEKYKVLFITWETPLKSNIYYILFIVFVVTTLSNIISLI